MADDNDVCAICLEKKQLTVATSCKHQFCFLCIKSMRFHHDNNYSDDDDKSFVCPLCRAPIDKIHLTCDLTPHNGGAKWAYSSRDCKWWMYDDRTSKTLEEHFQKNEVGCEIYLVGQWYDIDFKTMTQQQRNCPDKKRFIQRNCQDTKGVAGVVYTRGH